MCAEVVTRSSCTFIARNYGFSVLSCLIFAQKTAISRSSCRRLYGSNFATGLHATPLFIVICTRSLLHGPRYACFLCAERIEIFRRTPLGKNLSKEIPLVGCLFRMSSLLRTVIEVNRAVINRLLLSSLFFFFKLPSLNFFQTKGRWDSKRLPMVRNEEGEGNASNARVGNCKFTVTVA